jgi:hypothetical protein
MNVEVNGESAATLELPFRVEFAGVRRRAWHLLLKIVYQ